MNTRLFLSKPSASASILLLWGLQVFLSQLPAQLVDRSFAIDDIQFGAGKTKIAFDSAGRLYVAEKRGRLLQFGPDGDGGFQEPVVLLDIQDQVNPSTESGLLGLALDPDLATNRFIYLFFTTDTDQRLVRYTLTAAFDAIENNSASILLSGLPREVPFHKAGDIGIHPLDPDAVFIALGDDAHLSRPFNLDFYEGKILRVNKANGEGLPDNPFWNNDAGSVRSRVWARGFRNPFRFAFHPARADILFISENGDSRDRVAVLSAGSNGRWGPDGDYGSNDGIDSFLTVNQSDFRVLETGGPSYIGIEIVTDGPFAYNGLPTVYLGDWWPDPVVGIRRFTLSGDQLSNFQLTPIPDGSGGDYFDAFAIGVDIQLAPDGHLYFTETGGEDSSDPWYGLRRYRFSGGTPPTAAFSPSSSSVNVHDNIEFSDSSTFSENPIVSWLWEFGDGSISTEQNPQHNYAWSGAYNVTLTVTDSIGLTDTVYTEILVYVETPVSLDLTVLDARNLPATQIQIPLEITLFQLDGTRPVSFSGGDGPESNRLSTDSSGRVLISFTLPLLNPGFIIDIRDLSDTGYQPARLSAEVFLSEENSINRTVHLSDTAIFGQVVTAAGDPARVDIALSQNGQPFVVGGGRDVLSTSALPGSGVANRLESDFFGFFYIPVPSLSQTATLDLSLAEEINRMRFTRINQSLAISPGQGVSQNLTIGEWSGGGYRDDLSSIPSIADVPFSSVQRIFTQSCIGCHTANTENNGGLDLTEGNSLAELINQPSLFVPGLKLVDPGHPDRSYLFEKINTWQPQTGARMRPTEAMPAEDQALIRDWISQSALSWENYLRTVLGTPSGSPQSGLADDLNQNGIPNVIEYSELIVRGIQTPEPNHIQADFEMRPETFGSLTVFIERSRNLAGGNWEVVASRLRGESQWRTASHIQLVEPSERTIRLIDETSALSPTFYRVAFREF